MLCSCFACERARRCSTQGDRLCRPTLSSRFWCYRQRVVPGLADSPRTAAESSNIGARSPQRPGDAATGIFGLPDRRRPWPGDKPRLAPAAGSTWRSRTMSLIRNTPVVPDRRGSPLGAHTPGVVAVKLSVVRKVRHDPSAPSAAAGLAADKSRLRAALQTSVHTSRRPCWRPACRAHSARTSTGFANGRRDPHRLVRRGFQQTEQKKLSSSTAAAGIPRFVQARQPWMRLKAWCFSG